MKKDLRSAIACSTLSHIRRACAQRAVAVAILAITTVCGCTLLDDNNGTSAWNTNGVLALSRPVPEFPARLSASLTENHSSSGAIAANGRAMLGFMPTKHSQSQASLTINRTDNSGELSRPNDFTPHRFTIEGAQQLPVGTYTVLLKQQAPLWYAPDRYFIDRDLNVPGQGARERFRRGALGSQAIFLSGEIPIHAGPLWSAEIGGVRLEPSDISILFEALQVGAEVNVR
jgi:hypothetical protein